MPVINVTLPSNDTTADVGDYNDPITIILGVLNGQLDDDNIAEVSGTKIIDGTLSEEAFNEATKTGWLTGLPAPNTITYLGNRSYSIVFNSTDLTDQVGNGMRLRLTRTVPPPTQCTDLESGSSQYWLKTSPAGTTFTDDFCTGAWVKLESYTGAVQSIVTRYNGTSGWTLDIDTDGSIRLRARNAGSSNFSMVKSYQALPLNKWVHVAAQLDMSAFTATATTSYIMIDGVSVPVEVSRGGTNPTALIQAGNLEIGAQNGGTGPLDGKLAQVWYSSAKITQATIQSYISQGMAGSETSIVSLFKFDGDGNDSNANANNLTAQASAAATTLDSPFNTTEFAVITANAYSTNTTLTVQVPEGYAIPTSGGVSAVAYSTQDVPYGFPRDRSKWRIGIPFRTQVATTSNATFGTYSSSGYAINVPIGAWKVGAALPIFNATTTRVIWNLSDTTSIIGVAAGSENLSWSTAIQAAAASTSFNGSTIIENAQNLTSAGTYILYTHGATTSAGLDSDNQKCELYAEFNYV